MTAAKLIELEARATEGPWWKWPDMPYLFSGNKEQKNSYMHATRVCRIDYTPNDAELIAYLRNHCKDFIRLMEAAEEVCVIGDLQRLSDGLAKLRLALAAFEEQP